MFKVGDVVNLKIGTFGQTDPEKMIGWTIKSKHITTFGYEYVVGRNGWQSRVLESEISPYVHSRPTPQPKVENEVKFKVGDVVGLKVGAKVECGGELRLTVQDDFRDRWAVLEISSLRCLVFNGIWTGWVDVGDVIPRPSEQPKAANEVKFAVGDVVYPRLGTEIKPQYYVLGLSGKVDIDSGWRVISTDYLDDKHPRCYVENNGCLAWVFAKDLTLRPAERLLHLTIPMKVVGITAVDGYTAPKLLLASDDGTDTASTFATDCESKTIHYGDEYTVTIAKKGC